MTKATATVDDQHRGSDEHRRDGAGDQQRAHRRTGVAEIGGVRLGGGGTVRVVTGRVVVTCIAWITRIARITGAPGAVVVGPEWASASGWVSDWAHRRRPGWRRRRSLLSTLSSSSAAEPTEAAFSTRATPGWGWTVTSTWPVWPTSKVPNSQVTTSTSSGRVSSHAGAAAAFDPLCGQPPPPAPFFLRHLVGWPLPRQRFAVRPAIGCGFLRFQCRVGCDSEPAVRPPTGPHDAGARVRSRDDA